MGNVDLFHSRRTCFTECKYWNRDQRNVIDANKWVLQNIPSGSFWAKEVSPQYNQFGQIGNSFQFNKDGITLESRDDLSDIAVGSIVMYNGHAWTVDNVQKEVYRKQTQFSENISYKYYLSLRR